MEFMTVTCRDPVGSNKCPERSGPRPSLGSKMPSIIKKFSNQITALGKEKEA